MKKSDHITYTPRYTVYNTYADDDNRDTVGSAILVRIKFKFVRNAYYCVCLLLVPYIDEIENLNCSTNAVMFSYFITFLAWNWSWQLSSWSWSHSSWICNYLCNQCLKLWVRNHVPGEVYSIQHYVIKFVSDRGVLDTTLYGCRWFSPGTAVSFTNKTCRHDIAKILLKVTLNTINLTKPKQMCIVEIHICGNISLWYVLHATMYFVFMHCEYVDWLHFPVNVQYDHSIWCNMQLELHFFV